MIWNQRIAQLRAESGMTLKDIADQIGVSEATAQRYEKSIKNIPYDVIIKYSEIFDVSPSYIMGWSNKPGEPASKDIMVKVTEEEYALLESYRHASDQQRRIAEYALRLGGEQ